jgi:hypothetical protein
MGRTKLATTNCAALKSCNVRGACSLGSQATSSSCITTRVFFAAACACSARLSAVRLLFLRGASTSSSAASFVSTTNEYTRVPHPCQHHCVSGAWVPVSSEDTESSRASPPHRPREGGLAHPADTSRTNLAEALGLLSRRRRVTNLYHLRVVQHPTAHAHRTPITRRPHLNREEGAGVRGPSGLLTREARDRESEKLKEYSDVKVANRSNTDSGGSSRRRFATPAQSP